MLSAVSTLLLGLVLGALLLVSARWAPMVQPATTPTQVLHRHAPLLRPFGATGWLHTISGSPLPPGGDTERAMDVAWSLAARLGLGFQPPRKVVTGRQARIRLWHRFRSVVMLALIVVVGGSALAGVVGLLLFAGSFLVEQAIG